MINHKPKMLMNFISDLFGGGGGNSGGAGMNYNAQGVPIQQGVNTGQVDTAYNQVQGALGNQNAFVNALANQGSINNLSNIYNQQQGLANQYQGVINGTGPNPAMAQLNNTTGQNVSNQSALMAGQRGSGANTGLIARQAGMQGANTQQQAVGQGAALQAQQSLGAMQGLQSQQNLMGNQQLNQTALQLGGANQYAGNTVGEQSNLLSGLTGYNNSNIAMQSNINNANAGIAGVTAQGQSNLLGGLMGGLGTVFASSGGAGASEAPFAADAFMAKGGMVPHYADGGMSGFAADLPSSSDAGPKSYVGQFFSSSAPAIKPMTPSASMGASAMPSFNPQKPGMYNGAKGMTTGIGKILGSFGGGAGASEAPFAADAFMAKGGEAKKPINGDKLAAKGKPVPGKAKVKGDSLKNDKVPAVLSPGEVILPRSVMNSPDPVGNAAKFVQAIMAKNKLGRV